MAGSEVRWGICRCFYSQNIFLKKYCRHVKFQSRDQFLSEFGEELGILDDEEKQEQVVKEIEAEIRRRKEIERDSQNRKKIIQEKYKPKHPDIYRLQESFLHPTFLSITQYCRRLKGSAPDPKDLPTELQEIHHGRIYTFPVFTTEFCRLFMEEIEHLESCPDVPKGRPNTMNNYGVLLSDFGFDEHFLTPLRLNYLGDVARALYPEWCNPLATPDNEGDPPLDSHRGFVVSYDAETAGKDVDLDTHFDDAEVTLNVCLGRAFQGGDLYFTAIHQVNEHEEAETHMPVIIEHAVGTGVLHRGRQYHGAFPIEAGVRSNLIIWMRASTVRGKQCPLCGNPPDFKPVSGQDWGGGFRQMVTKPTS